MPPRLTQGAAIVACALCGSCAAVWGFEDGTLGSADGGVDAKLARDGAGADGGSGHEAGKGDAQGVVDAGRVPCTTALNCGATEACDTTTGTCGTFCGDGGYSDCNGGCCVVGIMPRECSTGTVDMQCGLSGVSCVSCTGSAPHCSSAGTCVQCTASSQCGTNADTCSSTGTCLCGSAPACSGTTPSCSNEKCVCTSNPNSCGNGHSCMDDTCHNGGGH